MCFTVFSVILETIPETIVLPYVSDCFFVIPPKEYSENHLVCLCFGTPRPRSEPPCKTYGIWMNYDFHYIH